jgi:voltage-gated potassium channel Kch
VSAAAAFAAWLGASLIVLSEGRRGLAAGLALVTAGFAVIVLVGGGVGAAVALLAGGGIAVVQRLRTGPDEWGVMPPGSTARLVLAAAVGLAALWISTSVMTGPGAPLRFAALSVLCLTVARVLTPSEPPAVLTALAALALSVAVAAGAAATSPGPALYVLAALIAAGVSWMRVGVADGA